MPSVASVAAAEPIEARPEAFHPVSRRVGTKGPLQAAFATARVRVADGPPVRHGQHLPGDQVWLAGEHRTTGERKSYLANHPAGTPLEVWAAAIAARRVCEQMHRQMKDGLGRDHCEDRSWRGLHHHAPSCRPAFLQHLRLGGKSLASGSGAGPPPEPARHPPPHPGGAPLHPPVASVDGG
jgi:SRSO17 transposase